MHALIVEFIRSLYGENGFIPLHVPYFPGNEKKYLAECIDSTFVSYVGKYVNEFETKTANYTGSKYAIAVVNGTAALQVALRVAGVEANDEVVTQSLTFVATANAISHCFANPVFIDVDKDTLGMSPEKLNEFLKHSTTSKNGKTLNKKSGKKIGAIMPMHTFGQPCRIDEICEIASNYSIPVIEDSAESLGSFYNNKHTGTFGLAGVFSYNGNKTITTGGGGMIITDNEQFAEQAKHLTTTAKVPHRWEYVHDQIGYNYRLTNLNAAVGVAQMECLDRILFNKRETTRLYKEFFNNSDIAFVKEISGAHANYWLNAIILPDREERDAFLQYTNDNEVMTRPIWRLMNKLDMYKYAHAESLDNAEWLEDRVVNIPSSYRPE